MSLQRFPRIELQEIAHRHFEGLGYKRQMSYSINCLGSAQFGLCFTICLYSQVTSDLERGRVGVARTPVSQNLFPAQHAPPKIKRD